MVKRIKNKLRIRRQLAQTIYNNLKNTPPKDYPTTGEIRSTIGIIIPALKDHLVGYTEIFKKAEDLSLKINSKKISEEDAKKELDKYNQELREYNINHGSDMIDISMEEEGLKVLRMQFDREDWGKKWLTNIEEFGELLNAFEEAEKQIEK